MHCPAFLLTTSSSAMVNQITVLPRKTSQLGGELLVLQGGPCPDHQDDPILHSTYMPSYTCHLIPWNSISESQPQFSNTIQEIVKDYDDENEAHANEGGTIYSITTEVTNRYSDYLSCQAPKVARTGRYKLRLQRLTANNACYDVLYEGELEIDSDSQMVIY
ncbi:unnamed protein product [Protopolystoma xenopodis]|uniref:Uncharacterized protein n=1 Tax=Protopolystoma xenopodis TaxID=117903 RepID=A0A3S5FGJ8_9PLAT|nr:unnamed protein product [Protopolystoma xenopodis]